MRMKVKLKFKKRRNKKNKNSNNQKIKKLNNKIQVNNKEFQQWIKVFNQLENQMLVDQIK